MMPRICAALLVMVFLIAPAMAQQFQGDLDPAPHDFSNRDDVVGIGIVSATLSGRL